MPHIPDITRTESLKYYRFFLFSVYFASENKKSSGLNCIKPDDGFGAGDRTRTCTLSQRNLKVMLPQ